MRRIAIAMAAVAVLAMAVQVSQVSAADKMMREREPLTFQSGDAMNREVTAKDGDRIGRVSEVLADSSGRPVYLMLSEYNYPERLTPVPVTAIDRVDRNGVVLDLNRNWVEHAPHFAKFDWPAHDPGKWDRVRGYYGASLDPLNTMADEERVGPTGVGPGGSDNPGLPGTGSAGGSTRGQRK